MTSPDALAAYLAERDQTRARQISETLSALTPRELALVKEAAVMGYVRGTLALRSEMVPPDSAILAEVVASCLAMPSAYPTLARGGA